LSSGNFKFTGFGAGTTTTYPTNMQGHSFAAEPATANITNNANGDATLLVSTGTIINGSFRNEVANGISILNSGSNNFGSILVSVNSTGRSNLLVTFTAQQLTDGTTRVNGLRLQYRVGTSGTFTDVSPTQEYLSTLSGTNTASTFTNVALPGACDNQSIVHVRWIYYSNSGSNNRDRIRLDEITVSSSASVSSTDYYLKSGGSITTLADWGTNTAGTTGGPAPAITTANINWNIRNNSAVSNPAAWTLGSGSKIIVGDGTNATNFTIPSGSATVTGTVDVAAAATLTLDNATLPTLGTLNATSTVNFSSTSAQAIPTATYGNLTLSSTSAVTKTFTTSGAYTINGNYVISTPSTGAITVVGGGNASFILGGNYTHTVNGTGTITYTTPHNLILTSTIDQTLTGGGIAISVRNLDLNLVGVKSGKTTLASSTNLTISNSINGNLTGIANQFSDGGNTLTVANNISLSGNAAGYNFTGTIVVNNASGTVNFRDNAGTDAIVADLNNVTISSTGTGSTAFVTVSSGTAKTINIKGNLIINTGSSGTVTLVTNSPASGSHTFNIGGNLTNNTTTSLTKNASTVIDFNSTTATQTITSSVTGAGEAFQNLTISNNFSTGVTLASNIQIASTKTLTVSGILTPSSFTIGGSGSLSKSGSTALTLANTNTYTGGSTFTAGTLNIGNASALGTIAGTFNINGGTIDNSSGSSLTTVNYPQSWGGNFTFTGTNNLNLGTGTVALTASATRQVTVSAGTLTVGGIISGTSSVIQKEGNGTLALGGVNTYSGGTSINAGILSVDGPNRLGSSSGSLTINAGTFQVTGGISSGRAITLGSASSTFDVASGIVYTTSSGGVFSSTGSLNKTGAGTLALAIANTYSGSTNINGGTIRLNAADVLPSGDVSLDGGTLSTGSSAGFNETVGTLNLVTTGTIALGTGSHTLTFAASNGVTWAGTTLTITGWTGTAGATGTAGKIFVGTDATGLTAGQLSKINFSGYAGVTATILSTGEIVPDVSILPTISTVGTLSSVNTTYGTASTTPTTFTASGTNLTADISISAPSGFEISQTVGGATGYATTQTLTQSGGTVASTTIYVRLASTTTPNSYSGNVALTSTSATPVNVATISSTVTAKTLTITGLTADSRTYDGTTGATFTGTSALNGVVNSDVVSITGNGTASFVTKTVGTTKTVNVTGYGLTGANASNYSLTQPTLSADINAATLTVASGATVSDKTYDGNTTATVSAGTLGGTIYGLDVVSLSTSGTFAAANVGTSISVTLALTGADAGNYTLTQPGRTANITIASQTITFNALASKLTTDASFTLSATASSGLSVSYSSSNTAVATVTGGNTVNIIGAGTTTITASQSGDGNYTAASNVDQNLVVSTPIAAGDIVIIGYGSTTPDKFSFLITRDIPASTVLNFTDNAWTGSVLNSNENTMVWNSGVSVLTAGTVVNFVSTTPSISSGSITSSNINGLASGGDQVICYTGTSGSPTFIAAFSSSAWLTTGTASNSTSYLPTGLTTGVTASNVVTQVDNMYYNNITTGPISILRSLINTTSNWLTSSSLQTIPSYSISFTTAATLSANATITNVVLASGETFSIGANTFTINGAVSGSGTLTGGSTSNLTIGGTAGTLNFTNGSRSLNNLSLGASGSATLGTALDINGTVGFTAGGSLNMNAQAVTLKSTATATASVSDLTGSTLSGATNVTVERYIPAKRAWRALTSPVNTTTSINANWQEGGIGNSTTGFDIWSNSGGTGIITGGVGSSLLAYNSNNTWSGITNTTAANSLLSNSKNKPFMAFVTGPYGSNNITAGATATTIRATGNLFTGNQTYTCGANEYNFIGNPYASPLSLTAMLADTNNAGFVGNIWIWDANASGLNAVGNYNLFDGTTYTNLFSNILNSGTQIQSGQAFFVRSTLGGTFTIKESHKGTSFSNAIFRDGAPAQLLRVGLYKQINTEWSGRDGAMTVITPDADANQTPNKMANGTENVAFTKNSGLFASNHHLPLIASDVLNVKVWNTTAGTNYKLKIYTEEFTATNLDATLEDLFTNARTPLPLDGTAVEYPFSVTTDALSTGNRFRIVFQTSALGINNPKANGFSVLPNPVTGDTFQVNLGILATGTYSYSICNAIGQEVEKGSINNATQNTNYTVKFRETAATGIYIMKIKGSDNSVFTAKIIKK
jgi:autotransporter-associated beta strand protein